MFLNNRLASFYAAFSRIDRAAQRLIEARSTVSIGTAALLARQHRSEQTTAAQHACQHGDSNLKLGLPQFGKNDFLQISGIRWSARKSEVTLIHHR